VLLFLDLPPGGRQERVVAWTAPDFQEVLGSSGGGLLPGWCRCQTGVQMMAMPPMERVLFN
jgi:hypothetical protein